MKRLDGLDLLLTDWMLGFSILLLIAIKFAPGLVGKQINPRLVDVPVVSSPLFSYSDFRNPSTFVTRLRDRVDPQSKYLHDQLSHDLQRQIQKVDATTDVPKVLFDSLVDRLNLLLKGPTIFDENRFSQVSLTEGTRRLIGQNPHGAQLIHLNRLLLEEAFPEDILQSQKEFLAEPGTQMRAIEVCPGDNTALINHWCSTCRKQYPVKLVRTWAQYFLFVLLILFVVKYIHERSVLKFRLYEDQRDDEVENGFRSEMETLRNRSNKAVLHFVVFAFRIAFLGAFYLFLINLYLRSNGQFQDFKDATYYGAVLICGYFAPDLCLFLATKGTAYVALKSWLHQRMVRFLGVLVAMLLLCFLAIVKWNVPALLGFLIFLVALLVLLGFSSASVLSRFEQYSVEITSLKWLLLDVFNVIALVTFGIAAYMQNIDVTWIACGVLIVNVFDWAFNSWFYFSSLKFGIHAKLKQGT